MYRLQSQVRCPSLGIMLQLRGFVGRRNYGFTLLHAVYPIREYHLHARHHNPTCELIEGHHKHYWNESYGRRMAYVPSDIRSMGNVNDDFYDFLTECNISLRSEYSPVIVPF